jgi:hypothetical protein
MEKYLYFNAAADDAVTLPLSALKSMSHNGANTVVFEFLTDDVNGNTAITITTAANKEKEFMDDVAKRIAKGRDPFVEIANDEDEIYCSSHVGTAGSVVAAIGRDVGPRRKVEDVTGQTNVLTASQSGTIFTVNVAGNAATTLTLPEITATNIGTEYEFFVGTENTGGIDILTASIHDTTGDVFVGALSIGINAAWAAGTAQDDGVFYLVPGADDNQINLTGAEANGAGEVGSYVRVVAVSYSSGGHSQWQVQGHVGTDDPDATGAAIFVDRDA